MSVYLLNNFLHLLVAVIWIGGMIFINVVLMPSLLTAEPSERGKIMGTVSKRFTIVSWTSMLFLLVTGLIKTPEEMLVNTTNSYGLMITVKHILFLIMIIIGSIITFVMAPRMRKFAPKSGEKPSDEFVKAQNNLKMLSFINMVLGIIVLFAVSIY